MNRRLSLSLSLSPSLSLSLSLSLSGRRGSHTKRPTLKPSCMHSSSFQIDLFSKHFGRRSRRAVELQLGQLKTHFSRLANLNCACPFVRVTPALDALYWIQTDCEPGTRTLEPEARNPKPRGAGVWPRDTTSRRPRSPLRPPVMNATCENFAFWVTGVHCS